MNNRNIDYGKLKEFKLLWEDLNKYFYADYYTLTDWSYDDDKWIGWEFIDQNEGGFLQMFRRGKTVSSNYTVKLKGLLMDAEYELIDTDGNCGGTYTGFELMKNGFNVVIPNPNASAIIKIIRK